MKTKSIQLFLLLCCLALSLSCEEEEQFIRSEESIKTVSLDQALDIMKQTQQHILAKSDANFITSISEEVNYEDLTNTDEELAVIPVTTQYSKLNSRLVLLTIDGKVQSAVVSLNPYENSTSNSFSGEILITDTKGNFVNGFRIEENVLVSEYLNGKNGGKSYTDKDHTLSKSSVDCDTCTFLECSFCDIGSVDLGIIERKPPPAPYFSITYMYISGGGDEPSGNEWDLGGSGSGYTDYSPEPEPEDNPCDKINSLASDRAFKQRLLDLEQNTSLDYETGFLINHDGLPYDPIAGEPGDDFIDFDVTGTIDGFLHTHVLPEGNSIFSPDDIRALFILLNNGSINNPSTFVMSVVTGHGTSYSIIIDDVNAFSSFSQNNLIGDNFNSFSVGYEADYNQLNNLFGLSSISAREVALLNALENSGLSVLKGNSDYSDWQKIKSQGRQTVDVDCN